MTKTRSTLSGNTKARLGLGILALVCATNLPFGIPALSATQPGTAGHLPASSSAAAPLADGGANTAGNSAPMPRPTPSSTLAETGCCA
jgi:hypothetical protein